jgi:hypothetical protein
VQAREPTTVARLAPWSDHTAARYAPASTGRLPLDMAMSTKIN